MKGTIDGVQVDCIMYDYENLAAPHIENGIRLYGIKDIIPMKLAAIADNGSRVKEFIDIALLSTRVNKWPSGLFGMAIVFVGTPAGAG